MMLRFLLLSLIVIGLTGAASTPVTIPITVTSSSSVSDEEFVGPFASWKNVVTDYGAVGNCSSDDTTAIQNGINAISTSNPVLYFPAGCYKVSSTLNVSSNVASCSTGQCGMIALVGHDPVDTTIKWFGSSGGTLLNINGIVESSFDRITFDGGALAAVLVDQAWDGSTSGGKNFDTGNQYADDVFTNGGTNAIGYRCGALGQGCSEVEVIRSTFNGLTFGAVTCNANALDVWIWYSKFTNNAYGVSNDTSTLVPATAGCAGGNYHVAESVFQNSSVGDITSLHGGAFNIIDNFSIGSAQFIPVHGDELTLQRNTIIDTTNGISLQPCFNVVLLDNKIRTKTGNAAPVVKGLGIAPPGSTTYCEGGELLSLGNTYTVASAEDHYNTFYQSGDIVDSGGTSIDPTPPTLPGTPPNNGRTVYEASASGSGTTCSSGSPCSAQTAICLASTGSSGFSGGNCTGTVIAGNEPVVHLNPGTYAVSATLSVPANSDIQIIGDWWYSKLSGGVGVNPVLKINGPSHVVLRGFETITAATGADGILMTGVDQAGATVSLDDCFLPGDNSTAGSRAIFLDALTNVSVEAHGLSFPYTTLASLKQTGAAPLDVFFGDTTGFNLANNYIADLSGGANLQLVGVWEDGMGGTTGGAGLSATGGGTLVYSTGNYNLQTSTGIKALSLSNYAGNALVLNTIFQGEGIGNGAMTVSGTGTGATEVIPFNTGYSTTFFTNSATGNTVEFFGNGGQADSPATPNLVAAGSSMSRFRSRKPSLPAATPSGITGVQMYRVFVSAASANSLHITN